MTHLLYPGATHRRFEHSLGVMELASRVFDVVTRPDKVNDTIRGLLPEVSDTKVLDYWRGVLRVAALCHDLGHLPFSHVAEKELLPKDWDHERLTREIICDKEMLAIWKEMTPPLRAEDIVKLAIGPKKAPDLPFSDWETILAEIIVGDAFGVDRMDYLLRDSHHIGVAYGRFDHYRLIDTLRILQAAPTEKRDEASAHKLSAPDQDRERGASKEPSLGVEEGGLQSAEALLLARYFMYSQVYFHPIRRIYDIHLKDFLAHWLGREHFPTQVEDHLDLTDNEVTAGYLKAAREQDHPGHDPARRLTHREHFKILYQRHPDDIEINPDAGLAIFQAAEKEFGSENVRHDRYSEKGVAAEFPVFTKDTRVVSSTSISEVLSNLPAASLEYVFIHPAQREEAKRWLAENRCSIIQPQEETA
jgi:HD superfamily phosphohydrolase